MNNTVIEDVYPLSPVQQGILFHATEDPHSGAYAVQTVIALSGLVPEYLRRAWVDVVQRHAVLRTSFTIDDGEPLQVVESEVDLPWEEQDWRDVSEAERQVYLENYLAKDRLLGLDPSSAPLMRLALWRCGETSYQLIWTHHHLILDGWSVPVILNEVLRLYEGYRTGKPVHLPPPRPYADFIAWLKKHDTGKAEDYWRAHLEGFETTTHFDLARGATGTIGTRDGAQRYEHCVASLSGRTSRTLERLAQQQRVTLSVLMNSAWAVLSSRYCGQRDVVFGVTVAGRPAELPGVEQMVGIFINTLPLRVRIEPLDSLLDIVHQVQQQQMAMREFEHTPLVQIQGWSDIPRGRALFEHVMVFEKYPADSLEKTFRASAADGLQAARSTKVGEQPHYPLAALVLPGADISLGLLYDRTLYDDATMTRLLDHWARVLEEMAADPEQPVGTLSLLSPDERRQIVDEWNGDGAIDGPADCLHELFEAQVARRPAAVAVVDDAGDTTYEALDARATQIAEALRTLGFEPGARVAVCLERSAAAVAAFLGILKSGAAYVPVEPSWPPERMAAMLTAAQARGLVTTRAHLDPLTILRDKVPSLDAVVCLEDETGSPSEPDVVRWRDRVGAVRGAHAPRPRPHPDDLAYVIFTSGSTGVPKGVAVTHRTAARVIAWVNDTCAIGPADRVLCVASFGFDLSVYDLFGALAAGGAVRIVSTEATRDPDTLWRLLTTEPITVWDSTPATLQQLTPFLLAGPAPDAALRVVLLSGDWIPVPLPDQLRHAFPQVDVVAMGGATEATIWSNVYRVRAVDPRWASIPYGRPIPQARYYVLTADLMPCPIGARGDLYIGGGVVAQGYLGDPRQTAARFVPDPFAAAAGQRLYRTGDCARWRPDGQLEFLGRVDDQVKIRGYRVELGEIETVLRTHAGVRDAVVVAREDAPGEKRLVAYVVGDEDAVTGAALRTRLGAWLPEYMIPAAFVPLDALPLTPNGKLDRKALPEPGGERIASGANAAPRSAREELLCGIWQRVLRVEHVGVDDNFFELGGHSLLATQVIAKVRQVFGVEVPLWRLFDAPTVNGLADAVEAAQRTGDFTTQPPLVPVSTRDAIPLSYAQQRLWFIDQLEPGSPAYNIPFVLRLQGRLDVDALERTFREVGQRHEVLRTRFRMQNGQPVQEVEPDWRGLLTRLDLRHLDGAAQEDEVQRLAREEAAQPFDLGRGPLLRTQLLVLNDHEHVLLMTMHHIISDGWSMAVLIHEVATSYVAFQRGEPSPLPPLAVQYADYAVWQRTWLQGEVIDEQVRYWAHQLAGVPALELPTDHPRPPSQSYRGARVPVRVGADELRRLKSLAQQEGVTLFMVLLAGLQVVLARWSGQSDVSVGTVVANRTRTEVEDLIGFFVNTLVMRSSVPGAETVRAWLGRVRRTCLGAYVHQDLPFEQLVDALNPERHLSRTPLFQVMFMLQNIAMPSLQFPELRLSSMEGDASVVRFDLELLLGEEDQQLVGTFGYATDLFEADTIARLAAHWTRVLEEMAADPGQPVGALSLLSPDERRQIVDEWNGDGAIDGPADCLHELFEAQVARRPAAVAVVDDAGDTTYGALDGRATQIAEALRTLGFEPGARVAVCLERSAAAVAAFLGILKSGAAYVPVEPSWPPERMAAMLTAAQARGLVTTRAHLDPLTLLRDKVPSLEAVVCLEDDTGSPRAPDVVRWRDRSGAARGARAPRPRPHPDDLAYVIFTSGSTGVPKGVAVTHRTAARVIAWVNDTCAIGPTDRVLCVASFGFDLSVYDLFGALAAGGAVRIVSTEATRDPDTLWRLLTTEPITVWDSTPATLQQLTPFLMAGPAPDAALRVVLLSGDWIPVPLPDQLRHAFPQVDVVAMGGATEATIWSNVYRVRAVDPRWASIPYGRPIPQARYYVLTADLMPCPIGARGDLYIGGGVVAQGYLGDPRQTAARFVPDPFAAAAGQRLYRTGDCARWRPDGQLEFLGRVDDQVKIRGYRVELGEIETVLRTHAGVRDAVVVAREDAPGEKRLVAYVVGDEDAITGAELRTRLGAWLPEYMIPAAFVPLDALPLTPNGKLDRKALPEPGGERTAGGAYVPPRTMIEELLSGIWQRVLRVEHVGVDDNFFELGGHSLMATQVIAEVRQVFGVEIPLWRLFDAPSVAEQADAVEAARKTGAFATQPPLVRVAVRERLPLSYAQQRLWFIDQLEPGSPAYNIPIALRLRGGLDIDALERALREVVQRHESLRTHFQTLSGQAAQIIEPAWRGRLTRMDLRHVAGAEQEAEVQRVAREEAAEPFDLGRGPLLRARLLVLAEREYVLLMTMHHVVSDAWSMGVLIREVATLYAAFQRGEPSPLSGLPLQYADYAVWQRTWLQRDVVDEQVRYWAHQLADVPALELPTDHPRPLTQSYRGARVPIRIDADVLGQLKSLARREGMTLFMVLLAGLQVVLARWSGQRDVSVGTVVANRPRTEVEDLIGFFVNTLVLRTAISEAQTVRALFGLVREVCLAAYAHQDLPFEQLVETLNPERHLSRTPLFQVIFMLQNVPMPSLDIPDLQLAPIDSDSSVVRFDLELLASEERGQLVGAFVYATDLFEAETIARLAAHWTRVLEEMAADPGQPVGALALLSDDERRLVVEEWNRTDEAGGPEIGLHELFEMRAAMTPSAVAVVDDDGETTYGALDEQAMRLARVLRTLGLEPGARVAVCLERSAAPVAAFLGILKSNAAYVPLEPSLPIERMAAMLSASQARCLVTTRAQLATLKVLRDKVPSLVAAVCVDGRGDTNVLPLVMKWRRASGESDNGPNGGGGARPAHPDDLAYVIFTSGSTGVPKGVAVTHRAAAHVIAWVNETCAIGPSDRVLCVSSFGFDLSVYDLFGALAAGGAVRIVSADVTRDPDALWHLLTTEPITVWDSTPATLQQLAPFMTAGPAPGASLRVVLLSGDWIPVPLPDQVRHAFPRAEVVALGGATEATIWSNVYRVGDVDPRWASIPYGRPIPKARYYVLTPDLMPCPIGARGDLYIGGAVLAQGYIGDPRQTATRFVPDRFASAPGQRLYRTGDRARWRWDGELEFLGRVDDQVKIRGYRVELGEIEAVLRMQADIREAVVVAREDVPGQKRLIAYIVCDATPDGPELRKRLGERLPEYMIPAAFVPLEALPLTANGKVDRKALPALVADRTAGGTHVAPRTEVEAVLCEIWQRVLRVERVGIEDNFFDLGGDSIVSIQIAAEAREAGVQIGVQELFRAPTIAALAEAAAETALLAGAKEWSPVVSISTTGTRPPIFCVHPLGGGVGAYRDLARHLGSDQPFHALQAKEFSEPPTVRDAADSIEQMAARYVDAIRAIQPRGPICLAGWSFGGAVAYEMARQLEGAGLFVNLVALLDSRPGSERIEEIDEGSILYWAAAELAVRVGKTMPVTWQDLHRVDPADRRTYLAEKLRPITMVNADAGLQMADPLMKWIRIRERMWKQYRPGPCSAPIVMFRASEADDGIDAASMPEALEPARGWEAIAHAPVHVEWIPGSHLTLVTEPHVRVLAARLAAWIGRVADRPSIAQMTLRAH